MWLGFKVYPAISCSQFLKIPIYIYIYIHTHTHTYIYKEKCYKIPIVPTYYPVKPQPRERAWPNQQGEKPC